jgi:catechol 2,3-dioxygenase-like lactoylglutathione lyase family enzyme
MLKKIDHINIVVTNLDEAKQFFSILGFEELHSAELKGEWVSKIVGLPDAHATYTMLALPQTETKLELIQYKSPPSKQDPLMGKSNQLGYRHIAFEVTGIEEIVSELKENNVQFLSDIQVYPATGKKLVYFYGPDGVLLELAEYGGG